MSPTPRIRGLLASLFLLATVPGVKLLFAEEAGDRLWTAFTNPPAEARPFVRWWWNGNRLEETEILRQLDVLAAAGIGGVEINPIALPEEADSLGLPAVPWLSPEWNRLLALAATGARERGLLTDMIVGSGWPFGGEFLQEDETIERVLAHEIALTGPQTWKTTMPELLEQVLAAQTRRNHEDQARSNEVLFLRLLPRKLTSLDQIRDATAEFAASGEVSIPPGDWTLSCGILQKGHREVMYGALGAAGPVMNHYSREVTLSYLRRLDQISADTGRPLSSFLRALFCDSIELAGANWTPGFEEAFFQAYRYRLEPYLPFVFYEPYRGYEPPEAPAELAGEITRVRYDFNKLLVRLFLDNFTRTFQEFCTAHGLLARYQAYGTPNLMGMTEGNLIPDIPESNNWIYSTDMDVDRWGWNQGHGYMIWNLFAAAGGHLAGRRIISSESMTNTRGVFQTSLEEIKRHDDMNFISGINHTVLHGYNYSPPAAGFPGWIRFGAYFSEQNPWWPYFRLWADYNARISAVLQASRPRKQIAILGPTGDLWGSHGLIRVPFHLTPWYAYRLWEPISQAGSSCDTIGETIISGGHVSAGALHYGPMSYPVIVLCAVQSLEPSTARALREFVASGGRLVLVDGTPSRSLSRVDPVAEDGVVRAAFREIAEKFPQRVFSLSGPTDDNDLLPWTVALLDRLGLEPDLAITKPLDHVFQIRQQDGSRDLFLLVNSHRAKPAALTVRFPGPARTPWVWDPATGTRAPLAAPRSDNIWKISLRPLQSLLVVLEPDPAPKTNLAAPAPPKTETVVSGPWQADFRHVDGSRFTRTFDRLEEFGKGPDPQLATFAGTVTYATTFSATGKETSLALANTRKVVTEVFLNGQSLGVNWYGPAEFDLGGALRPGSNHLAIKITTVLSNYARSLHDNPTAARWTSGSAPIALGLSGHLLLRQP